MLCIISLHLTHRVYTKSVYFDSKLSSNLSLVMKIKVKTYLNPTDFPVRINFADFAADTIHILKINISENISNTGNIGLQKFR